MLKPPDINLPSSIKYNVKQPLYKNIPKCPFRMLLLGPSNCGKSSLISALITQYYDKCFDRIYIWSPSINVDNTFIHVKKYIEKNELKREDEEIYFEDYQPDDLIRVVELQKLIIETQKARREKDLYSILIVIDDFANSPEFIRKNKLLHDLFTRGRHFCISTIISVQYYKCLSPIIRTNLSGLVVFRLRNVLDLENFTEEVAGILDKKTLIKIYNLATEEKYNFLYINIMGSHKNNMFFINFNKTINIRT
jgi:GTPase SAR1 family protein